MKKNTLKKTTIILFIILISLVAFVGIYARELNRMKNIMPSYKVGMDFGEIHELRYNVDQNSTIKYYDADGNEVAKPTEDEEKTDTAVATEDGNEEIENVEEKSEEKTTNNEITSKEVKTNPDEVLTAENFEKVKEIVKSRLSWFGINEYYLRQDENGNVVIQFPESDIVNEYKSFFLRAGKLEIKDDETGELLLDESFIKEIFATTYTNNDDNTIIALLVVNFNEEGKAKLEEISKIYVKQSNNKNDEDETNEDKEKENEETIKAIAISIDGETVYRTYFGEAVTSGQLPIAIGNETTDKDELLKNYEKAKLYAELVKSGTLPITYNLEDGNVYSSIIRQEVKQILAIIIAVILMILVVFLTIRYNKGLFMSIAWLGFISAYLLVLKFTNSVLTMNSIVSIVVICIYDYVFLCNLLSKKNNKSFNDTLKRYCIIGIPLLIISIAFSFAEMVTVSSLGIALFWGTALMALYNLLITKNLYDEN